FPPRTRRHHEWRRLQRAGDDGAGVREDRVPPARRRSDRCAALAHRRSAATGLTQKSQCDSIPADRDDLQRAETELELYGKRYSHMEAMVWIERGAILRIRCRFAPAQCDAYAGSESNFALTGSVSLAFATRDPVILSEAKDPPIVRFARSIRGSFASLRTTCKADKT